MFHLVAMWTSWQEMEPSSRLDFQHFSALSVKSTSAWGTWNSSKEWFQSNFSCGSGLKFNSTSATCHWNFVRLTEAFAFRPSTTLPPPPSSSEGSGHVERDTESVPCQHKAAVTRKFNERIAGWCDWDHLVEGVRTPLSSFQGTKCASSTRGKATEVKVLKCCYYVVLRISFSQSLIFLQSSLQFEAKRCKQLLFASLVFGGDGGKVRQRRPSMLCCGNICGAIHLPLG